MNSEDLRKAGEEELEILKRMVLAWKESYFRSAPPNGEGEYLCQDFSHEIEEYVYPYVRRMCLTDHIDQVQASEFLDFCYRQVRELREFLIAGEKPPI
jgi:hypothetical protein